MTRLLLILLLAASAQAATKYVSPTGDDSNSGNTSSLPFATLAKALTDVAAGDTISLAAGTYTEEPTTSVNGTAASPITIDGNNKGALIAGRLKVHHAYYHIVGIKFRKTNGVVAAKCPNGVDALGYKKLGGGGAGLHFKGPGANNNVVDNCDLSTGNPSIGFDFVDGETKSELTAGPHHNTVTNCEIYEGYGDGMIRMQGHDNTIGPGNLIRDSHGWDSVRPWGYNQTITGNTFLRIIAHPCNHTDVMQLFNTSGAVPVKNLVFEKNKIIDCTAQFFMTEGTTVNSATITPDWGNWVIRNNIFLRSRIQCRLSAPDTSVYNNTIYDVPSGVAPIGFRFKQKKGDRIIPNRGRCFNNLFVRTTALYSFNQSDSSHGNNLATSRSDGAFPFSASNKVVKGTNNISTAYTPSQIFVAPSTDDVRLKTTPTVSPAIGAGINLSSGGAPAQFDWDYDGHARGDLWDIGAFDSNVTVATRSAVRTRVTVFESRRSLSHPLQREAFEDFAKELKKLAPERNPWEGKW
ncbi:MAG: DUF1565 domain-containing protein [Pyrinomonadaceae bacterium]|nr:DUF1565 domain-containing protein [Pyrinomonadaceae bacterium]